MSKLSQILYEIYQDTARHLSKSTPEARKEFRRVFGDYRDRYWEEEIVYKDRSERKK